MSEAADEPVSGDDLREFEVRSDARFHAVNARFVAIDGRFAKLGGRLGNIEQGLQELERRAESRCNAIERRIDAAGTQLDHVQVLLAARIHETHRDLQRIVILGLLGTVVSTAGLCLATILLVL